MIPAYLPTGTVLAGKYRLTRVIGKGGMGAVYAGEHTMLSEHVAIKILHKDVIDRPDAVARFINEARAAFKIQGEHVARVTDIGEHDGVPFMVMEYLEGEDLDRHLKRIGPMPVTYAIDLVVEALEGIAQAHALGIIHRDLKPSNLFLANRADGSITMKVLDFGISKLTNPFDSQGNHGLTTTKAILGSPIYMSPEQMRNSRLVDQRADIWSIGVIIFEILAGKPPFFGESLGELFASILETEPPFLEVKRPDVPTGLAEVVQKCLQKNPAFRYTSVQELASVLAPFGTERSAVQAARIHGVSMVAGVAAPPVSPVSSSSPSGSGWQQATGSLLRPPLAPKGKPWMLWVGIGAGAVAAAAITVIVLVVFVFGRGPRPSATTANQESRVVGIAPPSNSAPTTTPAAATTTQTASSTTQAAVTSSASASAIPSTTALPTTMQVPVLPPPVYRPTAPVYPPTAQTAPPPYVRPAPTKPPAATPFDPLNAGRHG